MLNHINKFAPAIEVGEFLVVSRTIWSDVDEDNNFHHPAGYMQQVNDDAANTRIIEALQDGWVEAGMVWGDTEKLIIFIKPSFTYDEPTDKTGVVCAPCADEWCEHSTTNTPFPHGHTEYVHDTSSTEYPYCNCDPRVVHVTSDGAMIELSKIIIGVI